TVLPSVALSRLPVPALATVLLKLTVAVDGSARIRSPELLMLKLSNVATAPAAPVKAIALPAAETVPPPEARIDGEVPPSVKAADEACKVVTLSAPEAVTAPESACTPADPAPETPIEVVPLLRIEPPAAAMRPALPSPPIAMVVGPLSAIVEPAPCAHAPGAEAPPVTIPSGPATAIAPPRPVPPMSLA